MKQTFTIIALLITSFVAAGKNLTYDVEKMGFSPDNNSNFSPVILDVISKIRLEAKPNDNIVLRFAPGKYFFSTEGTSTKDLSISDHNLINPRHIVFDISGLDNLTIDGQDAEFIFDGRIIPFSAEKCNNLTLKNFSIDFKHPQTVQFEIVNNQGDKGILYYLAPWINYTIDNKTGKLLNRGDNWEITPETGIIFERDSKSIAYNTTDIKINTHSSDSIENRIIESPLWKDSRLKTGMIVVGIGNLTPSPAIFLSNNKETHIENVSVHYAEGCGLIAQKCENVILQKFNVNLRSKSDLRCFTTISAASIFTGCKGKISSSNGIYENMMGEAIKVHGMLLEVTSLSESRKEIHAKCNNKIPFQWGDISDSVSLISSQTLDVIHRTSITAISEKGESEIIISLSDPFPSDIPVENIIAENTTWTPEVEFSDNVIRNNRAMGCQFSTERKIVIKGNLFSHVSGCAIHLSGECLCKEVEITKNRFIDVLTSPFEFSDAIIVISANCPEIANQQHTIHSDISIEDNYLETFDRPIVYANSVDRLYFRKNIIYGDTRNKPFNSNIYTFNFTKVLNPVIKENTYSGYIFNEKTDILQK